jgi:hypothetical protein
VSHFSTDLKILWSRVVQTTKSDHPLLHKKHLHCIHLNRKKKTAMLKLTAALLFSIPAVSSYAGRSLRTTNRVFQEDPTSNITCQLSTLHTTYETNDNEIVNEEETTCTLVEGGFPSLFTYPIDLPSKFAEKHERNIESSRLLVAILGATLIAGEFVLADDAQLTVLDDNFSPSTTGRGLLEIKDARDAFGERRLIAFRVNGANGERQVRVLCCHSSSLALVVSM